MRMMVHVCHPRTQGVVRQEHWVLPGRLGYISRSCLKKPNNQQKIYLERGD